jgi:hypothetical protein
MKNSFFLTPLLFGFCQMLSAQNFLTNKGLEASIYVPTSDIRNHGLRLGGTYNDLGLGLKYGLNYNSNFREIAKGIDFGYTYTMPKTVFKINVTFGIDDIAYEGILANDFKHGAQYNIGGNIYWAIEKKAQYGEVSGAFLCYPVFGYTYSKSQTIVFNLDQSSFLKDDNKYSGRIGCLLGQDLKHLKLAIFPHLNITGKQGSIFQAIAIDARVAYNFQKNNR